jgi:hypothetical protein
VTSGVGAGGCACSCPGGGGGATAARQQLRWLPRGRGALLLLLLLLVVVAMTTALSLHHHVAHHARRGTVRQRRRMWWGRQRLLRGRQGCLGHPRQLDHPSHALPLLLQLPLDELRALQPLVKALGSGGAGDGCLRLHRGAGVV